MNEIEELFSTCNSDLDNAEIESTVELDSDVFISARDSEETKLLFNLARLSIEDPRQERAKVDTFITSDLRKVTNEELKTVLLATEKAMEIPNISLKEIKAETALSISKILLSNRRDAESLIFRAKKKALTAASVSKRLIGGIVDSLAISCLALSLTALILYLNFPYLMEVSLGLMEDIANNNALHLDVNFYKMLPVLSLFISALAVSFITYPFISWVFLKSSLGIKVTGTNLLSKEQSPATFTQFLLHTYMLPISFTLSSLGLPSEKEDSFPEKLTGTTLVNNLK